ncbi:MAG: hypothetical protein HWN67_16265 [Candidatus Helarchaeota archaeon]|nr:hypothetical protein [Candidatus Helarchaeota archaeon]
MSSLRWKAESYIRRMARKEISKGWKKIKTIKVSKTLKKSVVKGFDEFKEMFDEKGTDPREVILLYCIAALEYANGNDDAKYMATLVLPKNYCHKDPASPSGLTIDIKGELYFLNHIREHPNNVKSYLGGTPDNNYELDEDNLELKIIKEGIEKKKALIVIQSAGKDMSTPVELKKNRDGYWKIFKGTSSIATGVKVTAEEVDDF